MQNIGQEECPAFASVVDPAAPKVPGYKFGLGRLEKEASGVLSRAESGVKSLDSVK